MLKLEELFLRIESPNWLDKKKARAELYLMSSQTELMELYHYCSQQQGIAQKMVLLDHLEQLLEKGQSSRVLSNSLYIVSKFNQDSNKRVIARARDVCEDFLTSKKVFRYQKIISIRNVWKMLNVSERYLLTVMIGKYYYIELSGLVLQNLKAPEREIVLKSIEVLILLGERRSLPLLRVILKKSDDKKLILTILDSLTELGNIEDIFVAFSFSKNKDFDIRFAACKVIQKRLRSFSFPYLKKVYSSEANGRNKKQFLQIFGDLNSKRVHKFMVQEFLTSLDREMRTTISWIFMQKEFPQIVSLLNKIFYSSDERQKQLILELYSEVYDKRCFAILRDVIKKPEFSLLSKITALETLSSKSSNEIDELLLSCLTSCDEVLLPYALTACLRSTTTNKEKVVYIIKERNIEKESPIYSIFLKFFGQHERIDEERGLYEEILLDQLSVEDYQRRLEAFDAASRFPEKEVLRKCLTVLGHSNFDEYIYKSVARMVHRKPRLLKESPFLLESEIFCRELEELVLEPLLLEQIVTVSYEENIRESKFSFGINEELFKFCRERALGKNSWCFLKPAIFFFENFSGEIDSELIKTIGARFCHEEDQELKGMVLSLISQKGNPSHLEMFVRGVLCFGENQNEGLSSKEMMSTFMERLV